MPSTPARRRPMSNAVTPTATVPGAPTIGIRHPRQRQCRRHLDRPGLQRRESPSSATWSPPPPAVETCTYVVVEARSRTAARSPGSPTTTSYSFTVAATNKVGTGPASTPSMTVIPAADRGRISGLPGANLSRRQPERANLSSIDLAKVNFTGATLTGVNFDRIRTSAMPSFTVPPSAGPPSRGQRSPASSPVGSPERRLASLRGGVVVDGYLVGRGRKPGRRPAGAAPTWPGSTWPTPTCRGRPERRKPGGTTLTGANPDGRHSLERDQPGRGQPHQCHPDRCHSDRRRSCNGANLTTAIFTGASLFNADL